jgi:RHS repeat-associated protein
VRWGGWGPLLVTLDPEGNRTSTTTPKGKTTTFEYDELGKLTKVTQPTVPLAAGGTIAPETRHVYDEARNRILQTDANGHVVAMEYDELNRLKKTTQDPGGLNLVSETVKFDENGNPEVFRDPNEQTVTSSYDELNRLKTKAFTPVEGWAGRWRYTASLEYGYDENSNLLTTDEHVASRANPPDTTLTTTRTYDGLDRLTSETQPLPDGGSRTVGYTYYRNGLRKTITDPADRVTRYGYDGQGRLETVVTDDGTPDAMTTDYTYWPDDLLKTVTYPNGVVATHEYDRADRLRSVVNAKGVAVVSSYQYLGTDPATGDPVSYDANGNRLIQVETNGGQTETTTYTYDDLDRLATVTYPTDATYPAGRVVSYGYDAVGNRIRETEKDSGGAVLADKQGVFDNVNRLTDLNDLVVPGNSTVFSWDDNGNQLTKTTAGVTTENRYDLRDKLVEVVQGDSTLGRFQYDSEGRRSLKIGEEGLRQYVYDQTSLLTEYDAGGLQKAKYDYGSDRLIALTRTDEGRRYFSLDGLRSVVNLTDDSGAAVASYHLDAWGSFRFPSELTSSANRFAFTGHIYDTETGLYNAKARYFDPKLGRFLTQDSYLGQIDEPPSLHRYLYVYANPTRYTDSTGHLLDQNLVRQAAAAAEQSAPAAAPVVAGVAAAVLTPPVVVAGAVGGVVIGGVLLYEHWTESDLRAQEQAARAESRAALERLHARETAEAKAKAAGAPTPQQGTLILEDEDANEVLADRRRRDEAQKSGIDLGQAKYRALTGGGAGGASEEEIGELQRMALEIQAAHKNKVARDHSVTAAGRVRYGDGRTEYWVSSSEDAPRSEQQELIRQYGAKVIRGKGEAEVTLVNAYETARKAGIDLTLEEIGASRPICIDCEMRMEQAGVRPEAGNPLKKAPSDRVMRSMRREQQLQGPQQLALPTEDQKKRP